MAGFLSYHRLDRVSVLNLLYAICAQKEPSATKRDPKQTQQEIQVALAPVVPATLLCF